MRWTDLLWMVAAASLFFPVVSAMASNIETLAVQLLRYNANPERGERAAFVVLGAGGEMELVHWPPPRPDVRRSVNWNGRMPSGVVAVIHTHPSDVPRPSRQDLAEARRLSMPFYVVSRTSLCMAGSDGDISCGPLPT